MTTAQAQEQMQQWFQEDLAIISNIKFKNFAIGLAQHLGITAEEWNKNVTHSLFLVFVKLRQIEREDNIEIIKNIIA